MLEGRISACPYGECGFRCCAFNRGNFISMYPGEWESQVGWVGHLRPIGAGPAGGLKVVCEAVDRSACDGGYKPLDCRWYPYFPAHAGGLLRGVKCPLPGGVLGEQGRFVVSSKRRLEGEVAGFSDWYRKVQMIGYRMASPEEQQVADPATAGFLAEVTEARDRIRPYISSRVKFDGDGALLWEPGLPGGSHKIRGVLNYFLTEDLSRRLVIPTTGNLGRAFLEAVRLLDRWPEMQIVCSAGYGKRDQIEELAIRADGIEFVDGGYAACVRRAKEIAELEGAVCLDYEVLAFLAGDATLALDILDLYPCVDRIFIGAGSGTLLGVVASVIRMVVPEVVVIGVCSEAFPELWGVFTGERVLPYRGEARSWGLSASPTRETAARCREFVDEIWVVSEAAISYAVGVLGISDRAGAVAYAGVGRLRRNSLVVIGGG